MKPRIHIIGGPGSGKSYAASKLAKHFGVPACHLDDLFWIEAASNHAVRANHTERDRKLAAVVSGDGWVIEGVYYQWLGPSFDAADFIVALTPPIWLRHWRVIKRFWSRKLGRVQSKRESLLDLLVVLRWSQTYSLDLPRQFIAERGRELIFCRTFEELLSVTENRHIIFGQTPVTVRGQASVTVCGQTSMTVARTGNV